MYAIRSYYERAVAVEHAEVGEHGAAVVGRGDRLAGVGGGEHQGVAGIAGLDQGGGDAGIAADVVDRIGDILERHVLGHGDGGGGAVVLGQRERPREPERRGLVVLLGARDLVARGKLHDFDRIDAEIGVVVDGDGEHVVRIADRRRREVGGAVVPHRIVALRGKRLGGVGQVGEVGEHLLPPRNLGFEHSYNFV